MQSVVTVVVMIAAPACGAVGRVCIFGGMASGVILLFLFLFPPPTPSPPLVCERGGGGREQPFCTIRLRDELTHERCLHLLSCFVM